MLRLPSGVMMLTGAVLCFGLRVMAIRRGWRLPVARAAGQRAAADE
jgi:uncharacterized membrane protein YeiH